MPTLEIVEQSKTGEESLLLRGHSSQDYNSSSLVFFPRLLNSKVRALNTAPAIAASAPLKVLNKQLEAFGPSTFFNVPLARNKALLEIIKSFRSFEPSDFEILLSSSKQLGSDYIIASFISMVDDKKLIFDRSLIKDGFAAGREFARSTATHVLIWMAALDFTNAFDASNETKIAKTVFNALIIATMALHSSSLLFPSNRLANLYLRLYKALNPSVLAGWIIMQTVGNFIGLSLSLSNRSDDIPLEYFVLLLCGSAALAALRPASKALEDYIKHDPSRTYENRRLLKLISFIKGAFDSLLTASILYQGFKLLPEFLQLIAHPLAENVKAPLQVGLLSGLLFIVGPAWQILCHKKPALQEKSSKLLMLLILAVIIAKNVLYMVGEHLAGTISKALLIAYFTVPVLALLCYSITASLVNQKIVVPELEKQQGLLLEDKKISQQQQAERLAKFGMYCQNMPAETGYQDQVPAIESSETLEFKKL